MTGIGGFELALVAVAFVSGATASIVGFGIGSLLTPFVAMRFGTPIAVAAVTIPHAVATAVRCWRMRRDVDRPILARFGLLSAAGGLAGALAYSTVGGVALTRILGALLIATAVAQLSGLASRWQPRGPAVGALGLLSGLFGGLAGNQGGLRAAALASFSLPPAVFVATSTATGLLVDVARTPVYLVAAGASLRTVLVPIAIATVGVIAGTLVGESVLLGMTRDRFARIVAGSIGLLGAWLLVSTFTG